MNQSEHETRKEMTSYTWKTRANKSRLSDLGLTSYWPRKGREYNFNQSISVVE